MSTTMIYSDTEYRITYEQQSYYMVYAVVAGRHWQVDGEERDDVIAEMQYRDTVAEMESMDAERPGLWH